MRMKISKRSLLVGLCAFFLLANLIPASHSQFQLYQSYFWITDTGTELSAMQTVGDLDADHIPLTEIVVCGRGNVTVIEGLYGDILYTYSVPTNITYDSLATGNLDADTSNEIVVGSSNGSVLTVLNYNTSTAKLDLKWEKNYNVTQVGISDVTGDLANEVIIGDPFGNLTVFLGNGTLHWFSNFSEPIENFRCLSFSQNETIDAILVLTNTYVTLLNITGGLQWQVEVTSTPVNAVLGDVLGNESLELIIKGQQFTYAYGLNGTNIWNSTQYLSESDAILLYDYNGSSKSEILIGGINGSYFLNGTGALIKTYLSQSSISAMAISDIFGGGIDFLVMGDFNKNITMWSMDGHFINNITLTGAVIGIELIDMNEDGMPDIITASSNGSVYIIGLPWLPDFTWLLIGIGIGCGVIIASIIIVIKKKTPPSPQPRV